MFGEALKAAIQLVVHLVRGNGGTPSREEMFAMVKEAAKDEATALAVMLMFDNLAKGAESVLAAFRAKPGEVPVLQLDITLEKP